MTLAAQFLIIVPMPALAFVALSDVAARRVPNYACAFIAGVGLATRIASGDAGLSLLAAGLLFAALFFCFVRGWCGGGDVKLLAACALLVPAYAVPNLILTVAVAGGTATRGRRDSVSTSVSSSRGMAIDCSLLPASRSVKAGRPLGGASPGTPPVSPSGVRPRCAPPGCVPGAPLHVVAATR